MDLRTRALALHRENRGKVGIVSKIELRGKDDLGLAYTPGVAEPCKEIHRDKDLVWEYTFRGNVIAVVTDGSAVRSEEHTSELQSRENLVCRLLLEKKNSMSVCNGHK